MILAREGTSPAPRCLELRRSPVVGVIEKAEVASSKETDLIYSWKDIAGRSAVAKR